MCAQRAAYPAEREVDIVLRDGSTLRVRPIRPEDEDAMVAFLDGLSEQSRAFRFFSPAVDTRRAAQWAVDVDYADAYGLVATRGETVGEDGEIVGHATYVRGDDDTAEIAFATADAIQGRGLATILLAHLAAAAEDNGITTFTANVMPENHAMVQVFRDSGFPVETRIEPGQIVVEFPTSLTPEARERFEQRDRMAAAAAVAGFLEPRSVALIGASRREGSVGRAILQNLERDGFTGAVHLVNRAGGELDGRPLHPSVGEIPEPVDVAIVAVPAAAVVDIARECGAKGVRSLVVISAGFAEVGEHGAALQRELVAECRAAGMRLVGPNCFGVLNTAPHVRLSGTFATIPPPTGAVGFMSQSGGLGIAVFERAHGLGLSSFVSVGNKADVSGNDLLQYWEQDPRTEVVLLYLESFGNPRKFARVARRVGRRKAVLAVKSGRSAAGARAAGSHTGTQLAGSDATVDALFRQAGVVRAETLGELFDVAALMANQPLPRGRRVAILTNAGGAGILCADACVAQGLEVVRLTPATRDALCAFLPTGASVDNPVDMIGAAGADEYALALDALSSDEGVDAVIVIFVPPLVTRAADVARAIATASARLTRAVPVLSVFMTEGGAPPELAAGPMQIPAYDFPEDAARALARAADYAAWRETPRGTVPDLPDLRRDEGHAVIAEAIGARLEWLDPPRVERLCSCYGIPLGDARADGTDGVGMFAGVATDPHFGPVVACGPVGSALELVRDVAVRLAPLTDRDAHEMLRSLQTFPLLDGWRGAPKADVEALEDLLLRISALAETHPEVCELDCNPILVGERSLLVEDVRVRLQPVHPAPPSPSVGR